MIPHSSVVAPKSVGVPLTAFPSRTAVWKAPVSSVPILAFHVKLPNLESLCVAGSGRKGSWAVKGNPRWKCSASYALTFQGDSNIFASSTVIPSLSAKIFHDTNSFSSSKRPSLSRVSVSCHKSTVTTEKPKWWWRSLACLPYLMPLHVPWMYAETGYSGHPLIEFLEPVAFPFCQYFIGFLPTWSTMLYYYAAYLGVVRRKEWPRFFRHHVITAMLLDNILQVITTVSRWTPIGYRVGKPMMHFWTAVVFTILVAVLACIRRALAGEVPEVPFVGDAAYLHMDARFG